MVEFGRSVRYVSNIISVNDGLSNKCEDQVGDDSVGAGMVSNLNCSCEMVCQ